MGSEPGRRHARVAIHGPIGRADLPGLYERMCDALARNAGGVVECEVAGVAADAVTVEALARLQLGALRHGCVVHLRNASRELQELVAFMGLAEVLPAI